MSGPAAWLAQVVVGLYPPCCSAAERAAMLETFELRWRHARRDPRRYQRWRFLARELVGLAGGALAARRDPPSAPPRKSLSQSPSTPPMFGLFADLRYAARMLLSNKGFTAVAVLTLGLGIGANTAIFSVVNAVLLRPLPYPEVDRLVWIDLPRLGSKALWQRLRQDAPGYDDLLAFTTWGFALTDAEQPRMVSGGYVSPNFFDVLGGVPLLGRTFVPEDVEPGSADIAILSEQLWRQQYGADPQIIGRRVPIANDHFPDRKIIGVMRAGSPALANSWELWTPLVIDPSDERDLFGSHYLQLLGRLRPGVSLEQARRQIEPTLQHLSSDDRYGIYSEDIPGGTRLAALWEAEVGNVRTALIALCGAVAAVLLIACSNVANLLMARSRSRARELAVRVALGAGRGRILRQLLTESLLLAVLGAGAGLAGAHWVLGTMRAQLATALPRGGSIEIDPRALGFTLLTAITASLVFGLIPALSTLAAAPAVALSESGRTRTSRRRHLRLHDVMVLTQVALSCALVITAGLTLRSLLLMRGAPAGFDTDGVFTMRITAPSARYPDAPAQRQYWQAALDTAAAVPGVQASGAIHLLPLQGGNWHFPILPQGFVAQSDASLPGANFRVASPAYFESVGIRLLAGRRFDDTDTADSPAVVIVNQRLAAHFWPTESAIGKRILLFGNLPLQVVGVVDNVRQERLDRDAVDTIYRVHTQYPLASMVLTLRSDAPDKVIPAVVAALRRLDPHVPIGDMAPMADVVSTSLARPRLSAQLLGTFALLALGLGAIGIYGVTSYVVSLQTREIGIRMALGARPASVRRAVVLRAMRPVAAGLAVGLGLAAAAGRLVASLLYATSPTDPATYATVLLLLGAAGLAACLLPAGRASRVDPRVALRAQ